jgi:dienelactone hydrolase
VRICWTLAAVLVPLLAQEPTPNERLTRWLDAKAQRFLTERAQTIARLRPAEFEDRKNEVHSKVLGLIGGLPLTSEPLNPKVHWTKDRGNYVIEGVTYESQSRYVVTANLYRPKEPGPKEPGPKEPGKYPAILFSIGHWEQGKAAAQLMAANFARKGFVVLAYDPVGQGERQQTFDAKLGRSLAGGPTEQHFMAGALATLTGDNVARYFIWDGMRGIDYLVSRPEVDGSRIGATGCSGGGTQTTYIAALDPRVKAAAPACYMQSFQSLFSGPVGDSEQSFPGFLSSGLDQTDYVELFSPRPWLIANTEKDYFTPAAAKIVFDEAQRWYQRLGFRDRVQWVVGPGGHGTPKPVREAIYGWMIRWLNGNQGAKTEEAVELLPDHELLVTGGQAESKQILDLLRDRIYKAKTQIPLLPAEPYEIDSAWIERPGSTGVVVVETGAQLPGSRAEKIAAAGATVLAIHPRGLPTPSTGRYSGDWITNTRAWLAGENLALMRAADIAAAVKKLRARPGITRVFVHAQGVAGWWAIYAAAHESGIDGLWLDRTPYSVRAAFDHPVHYDLHDVVIPGVIPEAPPSAYKLKRLVWSDPTDWMRNIVVRPGDFQYRSISGDDEDARLIALLLRP